MSDPYMGADGVLLNRLGLTERGVLERVEFRLSLMNAAPALAMAESAEHLNVAMWCAIHWRLFGLLYDWAGELRKVEMSKRESWFCPVAWINGYADREVLPLFGERAKAAADDERAFAVALAECWGELNFTHPFREGNGRATHIFVTALARRSGRTIDWNKVDATEEMLAGEQSTRGKYDGYKKILSQAMRRSAG